MSEPTPEQIKSALKIGMFNGMSEWSAESSSTVSVNAKQVLAYIQKLEHRVMLLATVLADKIEDA